MKKNFLLHLWFFYIFLLQICYFEVQTRTSKGYWRALRKCPGVGCPRNNQIFFSVRTETNRNSICFGCVSVCFAKPKNIFFLCFGLFRCFGSVSKRPKQTEFSRNKPKKSSKKVLYSKGSSKPLRGPRNRYFFFSVRIETNRNSICFGCFSVCFFAKPKKNFFDLFQCFGPVSKQPKQTELMVWGMKRLIF